MNFLERAAIRRAERQLAAALEDGEQVLQFDVGSTPRGDRVDCIATDRALYLVSRGGRTVRVPYATMVGTQGGRDWIAVTTKSGNAYTVEFGRAPRGVSDIVVDEYRKEAKKRRRVHVSWDGGGATFVLSPGVDGENVWSWGLDDGVEDSLTTAMLAEQALGELELRLGRQPSMQYHDPRPEWMPDFAWDPPLASK